MNDEITQERMDLQAKYLQMWLEHAPKPPERGDNRYDVFISYRSSDRAWAMALYDALKLAGWEPFLDQYDLVPGANLGKSLTENLQASSSGVILWSSRTIDSVWCERERDGMLTLKDERRQSQQPFNYVFAKLDAELLPLFARSDLYIDFTESPEGPRGVNLLRLMWGMRGVPLPPEAVKMAQEVDEDVQEILVAINGAVEAGNAARLKAIGTSEEPGILASPVPVLAAAQGLISMGSYEDALEVLKHAEAYFPKSIRAKQLKGLARRRLKRYQEAIDVLSELKAAGHQGPETLGILAAAWDGLYQEANKTLYLRKARELYRTAFQTDPENYYTGINAAAKSLFLEEPEEAQKLAAAVLPLVKAASDGINFWAGCTLGEVYLLQGNLEAAAAQYQKVIDIHGIKTGDLAGTRQQAERICGALKLSEEEKKKVLAPFELLNS
jgi:tetratricopeptide (TPR) repeat protein